MKNYFKKFSIMFVMLLAVIGFGTIQNGTVANAAIKGDQLKAAEQGWQRIDDSDSRISYVGDNWYKNLSEYCTQDGLNNWMNNKTVHYSKTLKTDIIKFNFTGNKIRIITFAYNPVHNSDVKIKIDNNIYSYSEGLYSTGDLSAQVIVYENMKLDNKEHSVQIYEDTNNNNKPFFSLDAIDIDSTGKLVPYNESITLDKSSMNLLLNDSKQLTATTTPASVGVTWTSSDSSIATVDSTGKVIGVKEGTCTITATTADGLTATCTVTVTPKGTDTNPTPNPEPTNIVNIAHAKGDNTNNAGGGVSVIFKGIAEAQLSVVKTADVQSVYVGDTFTYTIVVTNTSTKTAKAVVVSDNAPNHIDFMVGGITTTQGKVDPNSTSKNIIVNVGDIPPSGTVTIKIPVTVIL